MNRLTPARLTPAQYEEILQRLLQDPAYKNKLGLVNNLRKIFTKIEAHAFKTRRDLPREDLDEIFGLLLVLFGTLEYELSNPDLREAIWRFIRLFPTAAEMEEGEPQTALLPLFRATFIRGEKTFKVVFRVQSQEAAIPYLEENFGMKPMMWNIEIQPVADPAPYADLGNGYIRDESLTNDEEESKG